MLVVDEQTKKRFHLSHFATISCILNPILTEREKKKSLVYKHLSVTFSLPTTTEWSNIPLR